MEDNMKNNKLISFIFLIVVLSFYSVGCSFSGGKNTAATEPTIAQTDEKRWVDGVLAKKKGLGF